MVAFFGRSSPMKPGDVLHGSADRRLPTLWEAAIRDAWCHDYVIVFEGGKPIWDGGKTQCPILHRSCTTSAAGRKLPDAEVAVPISARLRMRLELVPLFLQGVNAVIRVILISLAAAVGRLVATKSLTPEEIRRLRRRQRAFLCIGDAGASFGRLRYYSLSNKIADVICEPK